MTAPALSLPVAEPLVPAATSPAPPAVPPVPAARPSVPAAAPPLPAAAPLPPADEAPPRLDPLESRGGEEPDRPRRRYVLADTGFDEVPKKFRKFYRKWQGAGDVLAPNEVLCPVCKVVIRSTRELRPGDRVYCLPCMSRLDVFRNAAGGLEARPAY